MKKLVKVLVGLVVVVVVLLVAAVLTLPLTIGPIVKTAASVGGPKALGVPVSVGDVKLNPMAGNLVISQVKVGNPKGYSEKDAFAVDKIEVGLKMSSLMGDTLVIRKIQIDAPAISFESKDGKSNFDAMMANAKKASEEEKQKSPKEKKEGKKVVIEEFSLNDAKLSFSSGLTMGKALTVPVPSVTVRDIGKSSGGASAADAMTEVLNGILGALSKAVTGAAGAAGDLLKGAGGAAGDAAKGATEALKGVTGGAQDAASGAVGAAEDAAKSAADAAKSAADKVKKLNPFAK
ncbi:MAG: AsmA family protein [Kiritimatiellae bacterium]|nr:AsmA family protein [Kiritimatiellia bacterium]